MARLTCRTTRCWCSQTLDRCSLGYTSHDCRARAKSWWGALPGTAPTLPDWLLSYYSCNILKLGEDAYISFGLPFLISWPDELVDLYSWLHQGRQRHRDRPCRAGQHCTSAQGCEHGRLFNAVWSTPQVVMFRRLQLAPLVRMFRRSWPPKLLFRCK